MELFKKLFKKLILRNELSQVADEFEEVELDQATASNPHNITNFKYQYSASNNTVAIPTHLNNNIININSTKSVSKERADIFCKMVDTKIDSLIETRSKIIVKDTKSEQERISLTVSIEILEMTKELVKEVFINQEKY